MTLQIAAAGATDIGRRRENNEDAFLVDDALGLYVVCDGIGGRKAGDVASKMAAQVVRDAIAQARPQLDRPVDLTTSQVTASASQVVERAVQHACHEVWSAARGDRSMRGMGTTLDLVLRVGQRAVIGHVGDSRVYLVRQERVYRLTEDHTLAEAQLKAGILTPEEARESSGRGVLTRSVGSQRSVQVDTLVLDLLPDDVLVLCSDGLHRYLKDEELAGRVAGIAPEAASGTLVQWANQCGGDDNVTVVTLRCRSAAGDQAALAVQARMDALRATPLMRHLSYREQAAVLAIAENRTYEAGAAIMREGEASLDLYVVVQGKVTVSKQGRRIAELGAGGQFGEMALVDQAPRSATVVAETPVHVLVISHAPMMGLMRMDSVLGVKILWTLVQGLSSKLRSASAELIDFRRDAPPGTLRLPFG